MGKEIVEDFVFINRNGMVQHGGNVSLADVFYQMMKNHGAVMEALADITMELAKLRNDLVMTFAPKEDDPKRKEMSDRIGELVQKRLWHDQEARQILGYEPKGK